MACVLALGERRRELCMDPRRRRSVGAEGVRSTECSRDVRGVRGVVCVVCVRRSCCGGSGESMLFG